MDGPVIIDKPFLQSLAIEQFQGRHKLEAHRLAKLQSEIDLDRVTEIRVEILSIITIRGFHYLPNLTNLSLANNKVDKIENLECLPHLKVLNLSFNRIKRIENLEKLKNLSTLQLSGNKIEKIESLECLKELKILSLSQNLISTLAGLGRLRLLGNLFSLNLEGNPAISDSEFDEIPFISYVAAILPQIQFYAGQRIFEDARLQGLQKLSQEVQELNEMVEKESGQEILQTEKKTRIKLHTAYFTEHLLDDLLFDTLFFEDDEGQALLIMGDADGVILEQYRLVIRELSESMCTISQQEFQRRTDEEILLRECLDHGRREAQLKAQRKITKFVGKKTKIMLDFVEKVEFQQAAVKIDYAILDKLEHLFEEWYNDAITELAADEHHLFIEVQDAIKNFGYSMEELVTQFLEKIAIKYVALREAEIQFKETLVEKVQGAFNFNPSPEQVPELLKNAGTDKDEIEIVAAGMSDLHNQRIDAAEERIVRRIRQWAHTLTEKIQVEEIERHHNKELEILQFCDYHRTSFDHFLNCV